MASVAMTEDSVIKDRGKSNEKIKEGARIFKPHIVNGDWIIESIKLRRPADEGPFSLLLDTEKFFLNNHHDKFKKVSAPSLKKDKVTTSEYEEILIEKKGAAQCDNTKMFETCKMSACPDSRTSFMEGIFSENSNADTVKSHCSNDKNYSKSNEIDDYRYSGRSIKCWGHSATSGGIPNSQVSQDIANYSTSKFESKVPILCKINETLNVMASVAMTEDSVIKDRGNRGLEAFENLELDEVRKAGLFLKGCKIFLSGFGTCHIKKLSSVLNTGGATYLKELNESVTHIVLGRFELHGIADEATHEVDAIDDEVQACLNVPFVIKRELILAEKARNRGQRKERFYLNRPLKIPGLMTQSTRSATRKTSICLTQEEALLLERNYHEKKKKESDL